MNTYGIAVALGVVALVACGRPLPARRARVAPSTVGAVPPPRDPFLTPTRLAPGETASDCGFDELHETREASAPVQPRFVPVRKLMFGESVAALDTDGAENVRQVFELLERDRLASGLVARGVARGAVEDELARARLRAVRAAFEARGLPADFITDEVVRPSDREEPDTVWLYFVCPATLLRVAAEE